MSKKKDKIKKKRRIKLKKAFHFFFRLLKKFEKKSYFKRKNKVFFKISDSLQQLIFY